MGENDIPPLDELDQETIERVENYNPDDAELGEDISAEIIEQAQDISPDDYDIHDELPELIKKKKHD